MVTFVSTSGVTHTTPWVNDNSSIQKVINVSSSAKVQSQRSSNEQFPDTLFVEAENFPSLTVPISVNSAIFPRTIPMVDSSLGLAQDITILEPVWRMDSTGSQQLERDSLMTLETEGVVQL
ncbi:hypothetical protein HN698_02440, partial [Candidatus Woesearchaeota archaeon]|nr:hypothetical protein [Candidatus Woesearchaeota archaeon]